MDHPTGIDAVLKTIEPYLVDEIALMTVEDMINTFVAYTHPHASQRLAILDLLETKITLLASQPKQLNLSDCANILHSFSSNQIGSKLMIDSLCSRLAQHSDALFQNFKESNY